MKYKDEDVEFAHKILERRNELDEQEVEGWLQTKEHVELLNELAVGREEVVEDEANGDDARKSQQMTLRWSLIIALIVIITMIISQFLSEN